MRSHFDPRSWPLTIKLPLAVAALMVLVGIVLSERVLSRLEQTQARHLHDLAQSYLDGLSSAVIPSILRDDTWEVFDAIERAQDLNKGLRAVETIVTNADGRVIAASDPRQHPIGSSFGRAASDLAADDQRFSFEAGAAEANAVRQLSYPGRNVGVIYATLDTRHLAAERRDVLLALVATNGVLTFLLAVAGWWTVTRMMRPIRILTEHLGAARDAAVIPIASDVIARERGEFGRLYEAYNALVISMSDREALVKRLGEEERLGSLGRLTSALAHEINNPLGGLFNSLATLKSHGHIDGVRTSALGILERGLIGIRDVVRTTLAMYRSNQASRDLTATDIDDLGLLLVPEARRRSLSVSVTNRLQDDVPLPSTPIRQAVLNLLLNAVAAGPEGSDILLDVGLVEKNLIVSVSDRGSGMPRHAAGVLVGDAAGTPLSDGAGLGLWTTRRLVSDLGGAVDVEWPSNGGTIVRLSIPLRRTMELPHVA